jgi:endoglucanase
MHRRQFLKSSLVAGAALLGSRLAIASPESADQPLAKTLPRWRGFNLLEKFNGQNKRFVESDFAWIHEWGFDFVRLPLDYLMWTSADDPYRLRAETLKEIDEAVEFGRKHHVHVNICLHRAPGYTVAQPAEKLNLWEDEEAQKQFCFQWSQFAARYQGIPSQRVSFDLVNEPANVSAATYAKVMRRAVEAIRVKDPGRLVIADGRQWGTEPVMELADLGIAQSTRGYAPFPLTHYKASWVNSGSFPRPTWPLEEGGKVTDRDALYRTQILPWKKLQARGVGIHVGEWGAYNKTPHDVVRRWAADVLSLWREAGWGWALWNFRGGFGILDSEREDVRYEDFHGHKLDRELLEILRQA